MPVDPTSMWVEYENEFEELEAKAKTAGLEVVVHQGTPYLEAMLYEGGRLLTWVSYDPTHDEWASATHSQFFSPLDDLIRDIKDLGRTLAVVVTYPSGEMPTLSEDTVAAIRRLLPGEPTSVIVHPRP